jgi:hypothetical protein
LETIMAQNKCAHIPCLCVVADGEKFCSEPCQDAGAEEVEIACECGHESCPLAGTEESVA